MNAGKTVKVRWQNWTGDTIEELVVKLTGTVVSAESKVTATGRNPFTARYKILLDPAWNVRDFALELVETKEKLSLVSDGSGHWSDDSGPLPELAGAIDIDISITPFTNTIPIRRLRLREKQSKEILVVYVTIPELVITTERQRYTCLVPGSSYRFEQIGSGFARTIDVDDNGLVVRYPGLFRRLEYLNNRR